MASILTAPLLRMYRYGYAFLRNGWKCTLELYNNNRAVMYARRSQWRILLVFGPPMNPPLYLLMRPDVPRARVINGDPRKVIQLSSFRLQEYWDSSYGEYMDKEAILFRFMKGAPDDL